MITISEAKQHLNLDEEFTADDAYLESLISTAKEVVAHQINDNIDSLMVDGVIPSAIKHSMLLLIGNWYMNREPIYFRITYALPYTLDLLLSVSKNYKS